MEVDSEVWLKGKESKKNANDGTWTAGSVITKDVDQNGVMTIVVRSGGNDFMFSSRKGGLDLEDVQLKNAESETEIENIIDLPYLNEPEILNSLSTRYFARRIYTYTGNILIAINPLHAIVPDASCEGFLQHFASEIKTLAVGLSDGIATAAGAAPAEVKRHSIIISGESGSGKTECAKLLTMFLISAEVKSSKEFLGVRTINDADDTSDEEGTVSDDGRPSSKMPHSISQDSMLVMSPKGASLPGTSTRSGFGSAMSTKDPAFAVSPMKSVFFKAYQLSTMERIRQVTPILEAFGNACIAHTQNSSRLGKYAELSFSQRGDLVGGEIRTYLLENVRVIRQLERERNFHIFYQIAAGATVEERNRWAVGEISSFHYANQGGKAAMRNPLVDDVAAFLSVRENFASLGFEEDVVENILQVAAGILHLGQIDFTFTTALEGQVAEATEKFVSVGDKTETELSAAARLCSFSAEELNRCLTKRAVLLNKESFLKSLTPEQAYSARDAVAKAIYKRLFTWLVQELNTKLRPTEDMPAAITSSVGILDIFGFDSFAVNSFEQLCINYANEALQQHFSQHMFKLELLEYKREGIPFEDIEFPDNQESLDLITSGVFTILDDQCRIPNPTDKRFASQLYKELSTNEKFSASAPQMSANQFCVHHFAGPVVYATDTFTEKNLDQLPQDAAELLKNSRNPVLAGESAADVVLAPAEVSEGPTGLPKAPLPVMAAYVSKTKVDPASRLGKPAAAPARRGSLGGKGLPSVVAQLRNEVSVMMAHINTTVPHYVCCINPVERTSSTAAAGQQGKASQYQPHVVAAQLRYGGILGAVKVARSGLPHRMHFLDFFHRYRSICNPLNPVSRSILPHLPSTADEGLAKAQCELLVQSLSNTSGTPVVVSAIQSQLMSEMQVVLRKRSVRQWMGAIGGVINEGGGKVGLTKVFLGKPAHTLLESCLYHQLALCRQKIGDLLLKRINRKRFARTMGTIQLIQRIMRGALARFRRRAMLRQKAAGAHEAAAVKESMHVSPPENEVREVKRQDALIQDQIKRLVASNKVVEEPEGPAMDFAATKIDLQTYAGKFPTTSVLSLKTLETSEAIGEGYELLRPEKMIPLTTVSKALSFGRTSKSGDRSSSVKSANKVITKDHAMFKNIHKLMDRLRELFELAKLEKEVLDTRKRNKSRPGGIISGSGKSTPGGEVDVGDIEIKMATLDKVAKLARSIYQYYHQYILELVKQYGFESRYRTNFGDDNQYLLAFVALVEARKPLLDCEKPKEKESSSVVGDIDIDSSSTKNFPLYIPSERQQGPQHQGYQPLCSAGGVHFKVLPPSHAPGVEYTINTMHRLLKSHSLMYPIKYLKIIGKSGEGRGKESYYQAATEFGSDNLATLDPALLSGVVLDDFSAMVVTSAIFGVKVMHPQNVMASVAKGFGSSDVTLHGVNCDEAFLSHMFRFRASDAAHVEDLNVLYMMPQMDAAISPALVAHLSKPGAAARLTSTWLRELSMQNKRLAGLKSAGFTPADFATLSLPIVLPTHAGAQVLHMLSKTCAVLQEASNTGRVVTHSDLLVSLESALAERYAEQRIHGARSSGPSFLDVHKVCRLERAASIRVNPQIKTTFVVDVDHTAAEVLNSIEFTTLPDSPEEQGIYSALFDNFSFLPTLQFRHISESQLRMLFTRLLDWNKHAFLQLSTMRPASPMRGASPSRADDKIRPAVRTAVKSIVICGLSQAAARDFATSSIVNQIQQELGVKVSFDVPLSKK